MFRNFIVLAYRHFVRNPLTSFVELFGMTAALTVFLLVLLWVSNEVSYDLFNEHKDRIYRVEINDSDNNLRSWLPPIMANLFKQNIPEIEKAARLRIYRNGSYMFRLNDQNEKVFFETKSCVLVDDEFLEMFSFEFIEGNPETALSEEYRIVVTESYAKRLFPNESAMGKEIYFAVGAPDIITGVVKDPSNFHIPFDMLYTMDLEERRFRAIPALKDKGLDNWEMFFFPTYVLVNPRTDVIVLEKKMNQIISSNSPDEFNKKVEGAKVHLRPLSDIYFNGQEAWEQGYSAHGDSKKVIGYTSIAIFTILLACINFINLNSAKSLERAKEIGIKKVSGASRINIFVQFMGEVFLLCMLSLFLAVVFAHSVLSHFSELIGSTLEIGQLFSPWVFGAMILGLFIIALASGGFPALYLSSFQPVNVIKGLSSNTSKRFRFRKVTLLVQFTITMILLIGTITIFHQINYMKSGELGFEHDQRLVFDLNGWGLNDQQKMERIKRTLTSNPNILSASNSSAVPGRNALKDNASSKVTIDGIDYDLNVAVVDDDYWKALNLKLVEGRFFQKNRANDFIYRDERFNESTNYSAIVNQVAVKVMGLETAVGTNVKMKKGNYQNNNLNLEIIGVVKDFHTSSLDSPILPMIFIWRKVTFQMVVHLSGSNVAETVSFVKEEVESIARTNINIKFLDDEFDKQYQNDDHFAELFGYLTSLAILIGSLGLLGVATHSIKLRIKEIGIRKVMGASSLQILSLLLSSFVKVMIFSVVLAVPIAWILMNGWLDNYAYRIELSWWMFVAAILFTVTIALSTILWQSWQASSRNPSRLIRYE